MHNPFHFIENNFLAGRTFRSWEDLNQRAREWCDKVNSTYKKHIRAVPRELFAVERLHLKPLPAWIPEVYRLQQRLVDIEGYVALNSNRYSVPVDWIGRRVEVRETKDKIEIQLDARRLVTHRRIAEAEHQRVMLRGQNSSPILMSSKATALHAVLFAVQRAYVTRIRHPARKLMKQERHSVCTGHAPTISVNAALSTPLDLDRRGTPQVRHPRRSRQAPKECTEQ